MILQSITQSDEFIDIVSDFGLLRFCFGTMTKKGNQANKKRLSMNEILQINKKMNYHCHLQTQHCKFSWKNIPVTGPECINGREMRAWKENEDLVQHLAGYLTVVHDLKQAIKISSPPVSLAVKWDNSCLYYYPTWLLGRPKKKKRMNAI